MHHYILDIFSTFIAGFLINFVSNIENFYSYVKIRSFYSGIIGFICWMLTGLVFADILGSSENKFLLVFSLSIGGGVGNIISSKILKLSSRKKISNKIKRIQENFTKFIILKQNSENKLHMFKNCIKCRYY